MCFTVFNIRIDLISSDVGKSVVDLLVVVFVSHHLKQDIKDLGVGLELPVLDCDFRRSFLAPLVEFLVLGIFHGADGVNVGMNGAFLQVADESVAPLAVGDDVHDEEHVPHDALRDEDAQTHDEAGAAEMLLQVKGNKHVHALVLSLLKKRLNPAVVALHGSQRLEMAQSSCNGSGNSRSGLKEQDATENLGLGELAELVAAEEVEGEANELDGPVRGAIEERSPGARFVAHSAALLLGPDFVVARVFVLKLAAVLGDNCFDCACTAHGGDDVLEWVGFLEITIVGDAGNEASSGGERSRCGDEYGGTRGDRRAETAQHDFYVYFLEPGIIIIFLRMLFFLFCFEFEKRALMISKFENVFAKNSLRLHFVRLCDDR